MEVRFVVFADLCDFHCCHSQSKSNYIALHPAHELSIARAPIIAKDCGVRSSIRFFGVDLDSPIPRAYVYTARRREHWHGIIFPTLQIAATAEIIFQRAGTLAARIDIGCCVGLRRCCP